MVKLIIDKGADVNAKDAQGQTPLDYAAKKKNEKLNELLSGEDMKQKG